MCCCWVVTTAVAALLSYQKLLDFVGGCVQGGCLLPVSQLSRLGRVSQRAEGCCSYFSVPVHPLVLLALSIPSSSAVDDL